MPRRWQWVALAFGEVTLDARIDRKGDGTVRAQVDPGPARDAKLADGAAVEIAGARYRVAGLTDPGGRGELLHCALAPLPSAPAGERRSPARRRTRTPKTAAAGE